MDTQTILEIVLKAKDDASKTIEGVGKTVGEARKNVESMSKTFQIAGGILTGMGVAGALVMNDWLKTAAAAENEMAVAQASLKNVAKSMQTVTVAVSGNTTSTKSHVKEIQSSISAYNLQIQTLRLAGKGHEAEIKQIQSKILELKKEDLALDSVTQTKTAYTTIMNKNAMSYDQLDQAIKKVSASTIALGFDDETTYTAMVKNLGITKNMKDAQTMLSAEMELARAKNIEVTEAATLLSRAYELGGASLMRQGIVVDKSLKGMDLINAIYGKFKGTIENTNKTFEQSMKNLNLQFTEMKEKLGDRLLPTFTKFTQEAIKVLDGINKLDPKVYDLAVQGMVVATAFGLIAGPILLLIGSLPALAAGFNVLFGPLGIVLGVATALGAAAFSLYANWSQIRPVLQPTFDWLWGIIVQIKNEIMGFVTENLPLFSEAWFVMSGLIQAGLMIIQGVWNAVWPNLMQVFKGVWDIMKGWLQYYWGWFQVFLGVGLGILTGDWTKAWNMMKSGFEDVWNGIKSFLGGIWEAMIGIVKGGINAIIGMLNGFISIINAASGKTGGAGIPSLPTVDQFLSDAASKTIGAWKNYTPGQIYTPAPAYTAGMTPNLPGMSGSNPASTQGVGYAGWMTTTPPYSPAVTSNTPPMSSSTANNYIPPINIYATVNNNADMDVLGSTLTWYLRNSR